MKIFIYSYLFLISLSFTLAVNVLAQNPIIRNQFTADPSTRVFNGKVYLYPSHDIPPEKGKCRENWFCMEDYHVFSSDNLVEWMDGSWCYINPERGALGRQHILHHSRD